MRRLRNPNLSRHFTVGNVLALVAVFMLLSSTAYAASKINGSRLKDRSVSGKKLKNNSVYGAKLRANSVKGSKLAGATITGSRIASNTLTDREINMSRLGKISRAATADNAGKVDGKDASQLTDRCPSGTVDLGSACAENGARAATGGYTASGACTSAGGYLPSAAELIGADIANKISVTTQEWTSNWNGETATVVTGTSVDGYADVDGNSQPFRCFFALRER